MKSRSSTGIGMKIDLEYDIETMRISDPDPDSDNTYYNTNKPPQDAPNDIMSRLKTTSLVIDQSTGEILEPIVKKVIASADGAKLNSMLRDLQNK
jgi:hypothetical protein